MKMCSEKTCEHLQRVLFPTESGSFFCFLLRLYMFVRIVIRLLLSALDSREILLQNFLVFPTGARLHPL